jgi:PAS domain S-box-containing protein
MRVTRALLEPLARGFGGPRVLALPMMRVLATALGIAWVALTPRSAAGWQAAHSTVLGFVLYSGAVIGALWLRPRQTLRANVLVLVVDVAFALTLIRVTGGAASWLFLALLVIAGLQSYYYGITRGVAVAGATAAAYVAVVWPTVSAADLAGMVIRIAALLGTAIGLGVLSHLEDRERRTVIRLTGQAQARETFIRNVVEHLHEGVVAIDADGRIVTWNAALERRYRLAAADVIGRDFFETFPNIDRESWAGAVRGLLRAESEDITLEAVEHDTWHRGRAIVNVKGSLLREDGRPAGAVLLVEDITEHLAVERSARQAEKLASVGTLAAGVAHEINNPIGVISSRIELMLLDAETRPLPDDVRQDLDVLHRHAQRVARIAQGLLSFARQPPREHGPVDLNRVVEDTLLLLEDMMARDGVRVRRALAPALPAVWGDANGLQQVVMNLLTNARDAVSRGGDIAVETMATAAPDARVRLVVRDSGCGIAAESLPRIFDPFFTTKAHGTGLGLSITYGIVRDHQGTVDVRSVPGRGTTFTLSFPPARTATPA